MPNHVTDQLLSRQIHHLTQHLPKKEELQGMDGGNSYFRKVNDHIFCQAFERSHHQLNALKQKYDLTDKQLSSLSDAQLQLVHEIKDAYADISPLPKSFQHFIEHCDKPNGK